MTSTRAEPLVINKMTPGMTPGGQTDADREDITMHPRCRQVDIQMSNLVMQHPKDHSEDNPINRQTSTADNRMKHHDGPQNEAGQESGIDPQ